MTNPETPVPTPTPRPYMPRIVDPIAPLPAREDKFEPRYVEVPALRERGFGRRNLAWGVITLVLALGLLVAAVILAGQKALLSLAACLVTFTALYVLARMHLFRQRNGAFLAVAVVVLLGAVVPLLDRGYEHLTGIARPAGANAAPPARTPEVEPPLLTLSFALTKPDPSQTQVRVLKDSRVVVADKPFLIKAGDAFPLLAAKGGEVTFAVRDLQVALPVGVVEILGGKVGKETRESAMAAALSAVSGAEASPPKMETIIVAPPKPAPEARKPEPSPSPDLAAITRDAQQEAMRRYPALSIKDSMENELFVSTYRQLKESGNTEFFANPEWPLELAVLLATRNGWARGDRIPVAEPVQPPAENAAPLIDDARIPQVLPPAGELGDPPQVPRAPRR